MDKNDVKIIIWIFGILFSGIVYYLIINVSLFNYLTQVKFLPLLIILILIVFFFLLGQFSSKIPFFWYFLNKDKKNLTETLDEIEIKSKEEEINQMILKLKNIISLLSKKKHKDESIKYLVQNLGLSNQEANNIFLNVNKLKRLKILSIIIGFILSTTIYFLITNLTIFDQLSRVVILISSIVIFLLFVLEGFLITRMPNDFYLNLINLNKKRILEAQRQKMEYEKILSQKKKLEDSNLEQKKLLDKIKNATKFLLLQNIDKKEIFNYFKKFGIKEETIDGFVNVSLKEIQEDKDSKKILKPKSDKMVKLTLEQIKENFKKIEDISLDVIDLKKKMEDVSDKQKQIDQRQKDIDDKQKELDQRQQEIKKQNYDLKSNQNFNDFSSKVDISKEIKKITKNFSSKNKSNNLKDAFDNKGEEYKKLISYLYHLILPEANNLSKNDVFSILVSHKIPYEIIEDVLDKFKEKNIVFGKDKKSSFSEKLVGGINKLYSRFSK